MSTRRHRSPRYTMHGLFRMPMGFPVAGLSLALGYRPEASDIFVCTYPKCGTTWMQYIVYLAVRGGETLAPGRSLTDLFPHLEEVGAEGIGRLSRPRLIKTHLPFSMTPQSPAAKYIYVARNPFDCAVSFFHHTRGFVQHYDFADGTFDDFFECFLAGKVDFGDYFDHLISWYRRKDDDNVLLVTYEDMKKDLDAVIVAVGEFLGGTAASAVRNEASRELIREASSFASMSRDQRRWSSARPPGMPEFVRKGIVGDWRNHFSADQARRLIEEFAARTQECGSFDLWPGIVAEARELSV